MSCENSLYFTALLAQLERRSQAADVQKNWFWDQTAAAGDLMYLFFEEKREGAESWVT